MSRILIAVLIAFSVLVSGLDRNTVAGATLQAGRPMHVTVSFDGLMVFHREGSGYFVGILDPAAAPDHDFKVFVDGKEKSLPPKNDSWILFVTKPSTENVVEASEGHDETRKKDDWPDGQYDFNWIVDLDKLHPKKDGGLTFKPGMLNPIIYLSDGILYSRYKADFMESLKGANESTKADFGFFTETVALDLELNEGQDLVLAGDKARRREVFRLPYKSGQAAHEVAIQNTRQHPTDASDFTLYYNLFSNIDKSHQYDFRPVTNPDKPLNPVPKPMLMGPGTTPNTKRTAKRSTNRPQVQEHLVTCCGLKCNAVWLSTTPLK